MVSAPGVDKLEVPSSIDWGSTRITNGFYIPYNHSDPNAHVPGFDPASRLNYLENHPDIWQYELPDGSSFNVDHCLSKKVPGLCILNLNFVIMLVVIICNVIKLCCMQVLAFGKFVTPVITTGDAVKSFLDQPDPNSTDLCLVTRQEIEKASLQMVLDAKKHLKPWPIEVPKRWEPHRETLGSGAGSGRYASFIFLYVFYLLRPLP